MYYANFTQLEHMVLINNHGMYKLNHGYNFDVIAPRLCI